MKIGTAVVMEGRVVQVKAQGPASGDGGGGRTEPRLGRAAAGAAVARGHVRAPPSCRAANLTAAPPAPLHLLARYSGTHKYPRPFHQHITENCLVSREYTSKPLQLRFNRLRVNSSIFSDIAYIISVIFRREMLSH